MVLSFVLIGFHWRYYSQPMVNPFPSPSLSSSSLPIPPRPQHQRYIIRILALIPFYTVCSMTSLYFINYVVYISLLRDCYEAYVLYQFFRLCVNFAGGQEELERKLAGSPKMALPWPLCRVMTDLDHRFMQRMKQGILQYVIVRPVTSVVAVVCELLGVNGDGDYSGRTANLYLVIVNNVTFTVALYCLVAFYWATKFEISPYRPLLKFITIKVAVFFSFWQGILISILSATGVISGFWLYTPTQAGVVINAVLICFEMTGIAVLQLFAYPVDLYRIMAMSQAPLIHDVRRSDSVLANVRHTLAQGDTLRDTVDAFAPNAIKKKLQTGAKEAGPAGSVPLEIVTDEDDDFGEPRGNLAEDVNTSQSARR